MAQKILLGRVKGDNGKSAYEVAVDNGFSGTERDWLASLKGTDGVTVPVENVFGFSIRDGHLILHMTGAGKNPFRIDSRGHLMVTI